MLEAVRLGGLAVGGVFVSLLLWAVGYAFFVPPPGRDKLLRRK